MIQEARRISVLKVTKIIDLFMSLLMSYQFDISQRLLVRWVCPFSFPNILCHNKPLLSILKSLPVNILYL